MNAGTDDAPPTSAKPADGGDRRWALGAMTVVLLIALALRLYGLDWDAGYSWTPHPDERAILSKSAELSFPGLSALPTLLDAEESSWNPRWFPYGSFPLYLLEIVVGLAELAPGVAIDDLRPPARVISALADVAAVAAVYLLGASMWSRRIGVVAAGAAALAVIHIQVSHFFAVDTLLALLAVAAIFFLVRVARQGKPADSALAGLCIGLALATKISAAPLLAAYFVAHAMRAFDADARDAVLDRVRPVALAALVGAGAVAAAFIVAQPYALLDWSRFYADVSEQSEMVSRIRDYPYTRQYIDTMPYVYHIRQLATWGLGLPLGVVAWAGLAYVALRGMRLWGAAFYLVAGVILPMGVLYAFGGMLGYALASAISVGALLVTIPMRKPYARIDALALSWVMPYFLIVGALDVKFMRYLLPITPFLALFGARMLADAWLWLSGRGKPVRVAALALGALAAMATAFYALAYTNVYTQTHPATRGSEWIIDNAPIGSTILKEHWEESLPNLYDYDIQELPIYEDDSPVKTRSMSQKLADADYLAFYSNRLYGTVSRLPERYPASREYYRALFEGELGYELAARFTAYPAFLGVEFVDDTFGRPNLPAPFGADDSARAALTLDLGYADESFTVYDHPMAMIFRNAERLSVEAIEARIADGLAGYPQPPYAWRGSAETEPSGSRLMLSESQRADRAAGGTWSDIFDAPAIVRRAPALAWFAAIELIALASAPLCFVAFRPFADRGWMMTKAVGLLLVGLGAWWLASLEVMAFSRASVALAALVLAASGACVAWRWRADMIAFLRDRWKTVAFAELVFAAAFFAFVLVRMANPDLWHPYRGGEKPMDLAYLNAVVKSVYMPPYDPWFAGGYLNYYYWGQFLVGALIHLTGIAPEIAVNLAIPTFFAMTLGLSYSVVYCLADFSARRGGVVALSPVWAGIAGAAFVAVLGNLDGAIQVASSAWDAIARGAPFAEFDFWRSSRMMPPDPPGHEITEFPFFTFLFADPHAHLFALPFTALCVGLSAAVALGLWRAGSTRAAWTLSHLLGVVLLGVATGALRLLNAWDYPTYLLFAFAAIALGEYLLQGGISGAMLLRAALKSALAFAVGYLAFLPYHQTNEVFFDGIESTTNRTDLWQFLSITGLFAFVVASYCLWALRRTLARLWGAAAASVRSLAGELRGDASESAAVAGRSFASPVGLLAMIALALAFGFALTALLGGSDWATVVFVGLLLALTAFVGLDALRALRGDAPAAAFAALAAATALAVALGLDFVRVEGDIDRMNSVFKFYLQAWTLLALAAAYMVWRLVSASAFARWRYRALWAGCLFALIAAGSVFPALGSQDRLRDRFYDNVTPLTLDGLAFASGIVYRDPEGEVDLAADLEGIRWLRENISGSPVVLEANTPTYRWGGRVSIHTGLPSVVGWEWHQQQQRWGYRGEVTKRIRDVERIYSTTDADRAAELLEKHGVRYVYIGDVERLYYPEQGIAKFDDGMGGRLRRVFAGERAAVYEVVE